MLVGRWLLLERVQKYPHTKVSAVVSACMKLQNVCIRHRQPAPYDDGKGSSELRKRGATSRVFTGIGGVQPSFILGAATADANFAGLRTAAAGRNIDKKAKITKALSDAGICRPAGNTARTA